jgi:hypothetical protein
MSTPRRMLSSKVCIPRQSFQGEDLESMLEMQLVLDLFELIILAFAIVQKVKQSVALTNVLGYRV